MNRLLFFILIFVCSLVVKAQCRDYESAENIAKSFMSDLFLNKQITSLYHLNEDSVAYTRGNTVPETPAYYIYTDSINSAFVIVSGDERMRDVLAYSDKMHWSNKNVPSALKGLLNEYNEQFRALQDGKICASPESYRIDIPDVPPLITSVWDQGSPYNDLCPDKTPSGCVATAMSQIMNYHNYPETGSGSFSYISLTQKYTCSCNFSKIHFLWDKIKDSYGTSSFGDSEGREEVAALAYACGVSVGMDYDFGGSGAYMSDVPYALINFFNYNSNVTYRSRNYYNAEDWYRILCNELENGRPVVYGGVDEGMGGHAFIVDGCDSDTRMFHLNWGWGGDYDGYYSLDALNPEEYSFDSNQDMVINISAEEVGIHDDVFYAENFKSSSLVFGKTATFSLLNVYNLSNSSSSVVRNAKFNGRIGIGLFDDRFNYIRSLDEEPVDGLKSLYGFNRIDFSVLLLPSLFASPGMYRIAPYAIGDDSDFPTRIRTYNGKSDYVELVVDEEDVTDDENENNQDVSISFHESFESDNSIPVDWEEDVISGTARWNVIKIILSSENKPAAADGRSYACLEYSDTTLDLNKKNAVTKLITDNMVLSPNAQYGIDMMVRTLPVSESAENILSLYYEKDGEWVLLKEYDITNHDEWQKFSAQIIGDGITRFAFEGNLSQYGSLLLDDIAVYLVDEPTSIYNSSTVANVVSIYSITGFQVPLSNNISETLATLPKGVYIISFADSTTKLIMNH